jgi:hypothetical protein
MMNLIKSIRDIAARLSRLDLGYSPTGNRVSDPAVGSCLGRNLTPGLLDFYLKCDGFSLPDLHNGYFVHPVGWRESDRGLPVSLAGEIVDAVATVGSSGGGELVCVSLTSQQTWALRPCEMVEGRMTVSSENAIVGRFQSFEGFLERVILDGRAFLDQRDNHEYLF